MQIPIFSPIPVTFLNREIYLNEERKIDRGKLKKIKGEKKAVH